MMNLHDDPAIEQKKGGRPPEPRIQCLETHPRRWVCLAVAAEYLCINRRTLNELIDLGRIEAKTFYKRRKISIAALMEFERRRAS